MLDQSIEIQDIQQELGKHVSILDKIILNSETEPNMQFIKLIVLYGPQSEERRRLKNALITGSLQIEPGEDFLSKPLKHSVDYSLYDCYHNTEDETENAFQILKFTSLIEKAQQAQVFLAIPETQIENLAQLLYNKIRIIFENSQIRALTLIITESTHKYKYDGNSMHISKLIENALYLPQEKNHAHSNHLLVQLEKRKNETKYYQRIVKLQNQNRMRDPHLVSIAQNSINEIKNHNENLIFQFYKELQNIIQEVFKQSDQLKNDFVRHIHKFIKMIEQFHNYNKLFQEINQFIMMINEWYLQISNFSHNNLLFEKIIDYLRECDGFLEYYSKFYLTTKQSECWQQLLNYLKYIAYDNGITKEIQIYKLGEFDRILKEKTSFLNQIQTHYKTGVLFFGQIRVGKSTLVNLLCGNTFILRRSIFGDSFDCETNTFQIGHLAISQTQTPQFYDDEQNQITFIDIPGFGDQGTEFNDHINRLIIQQIYQKFEKVVIFLVIDFNSLIRSVAQIGEFISQFKIQFGIEDNLFENIHVIITKSIKYDDEFREEYQRYLEQNYNNQNIQNFNADLFLQLLNQRSVYFYQPQFYLNLNTLDMNLLNVTKNQILQFIQNNQNQLQIEDNQMLNNQIQDYLQPKFVALADKTTSQLNQLETLFYKIIIESYRPIQYKQETLRELIQILKEQCKLNQVTNLLHQLNNWLKKYHFISFGIQNQQIQYMMRFLVANYNKQLYEYCNISINLNNLLEKLERLYDDINAIDRQFKHIESVFQCLNTLIIFAGTTAIAPILFKGALTVDIIRLFLQRSAFTIKFNVVQNMMNGQQINLEQIQHQVLQRKQKNQTKQNFAMMDYNII